MSELVSNCCSVPMIAEQDVLGVDVCPKCFENCDWESVEDDGDYAYDNWKDRRLENERD